MALTTQTQIAASAASLVGIANSIKSAMVLSAEFSKYNGQTDPGWANLPSGVAATTLDSNGFIIGTNPLVKPGDVSNAIGAMNAFLAIYNGTAFNFGTGVITPNAWGNSLEIVSRPIV